MVRAAMAVIAMLLASPAAAKVHETSDNGFVLRYSLDVPSGTGESWRVLLTPAQWWSAQDSYSGDAANLSLDARAGGCFCEILPSKVSPNAAPRGSVEHMRVIYVEQPRALRMTGALGPLQSGAGTGTLTILLKPAGAGTRILWEYVYGGYMRDDVQATANTVDRVLASQVMGLGAKLGADTPASQDEEDAFAREMSAGIEESAPAPELPPLPEAPPPQKNDQGFIGR